MKHLDARGLGEYHYDYDNDIAIFKVKEREYLKSIDFDNFVVDIDTEGFVVGMRIFDASKILKIDKYGLKNMKQWEFNSKIEDNVISLQLRFSYIMRNKEIITQGEDFIRETIGAGVNSEVSCTA